MSQSPRHNETLGFKIAYYTLIIFLICIGPVGWALLLWLYDGGPTNPGVPGTPFYPAPQPVYLLPPPTGQPVRGLRAPVTAPEHFGGHWTAQDTLHSAQTLRIR